MTPPRKLVNREGEIGWEFPTQYGDIEFIPSAMMPLGMVALVDRRGEIPPVFMFQGVVITLKEVLDAMEPEAASSLLRPLQERQGVAGDVQDVPRRNQEGRKDGLETGEEVTITPEVSQFVIDWLKSAYDRYRDLDPIDLIEVWKEDMSIE